MVGPMKKNSWFVLFLFLSASMAFASNSQYGDLDPDVSIGSIPTDTLVKLNSDISLSRFAKSTKLEGGKAFQNFDDKGLSIGNSEKFCTIRVMFENKEEYKVAGLNGPIVIPSGSLLKVDYTTLGSGGYDVLKLNFVEPIHTSFATIDTMFIDCTAGMRAWWNNNDETIHLSNIIQSMGDRISILPKPEKEKTKKIATLGMVESRLVLAQNTPREPIEGGTTNPVTQHEASASGEEKPLSEIIFKKKKPKTTITVVPHKRTPVKQAAETPAPDTSTTAPTTIPAAKPEDTKK